MFDTVIHKWQGSMKAYALLTGTSTDDLAPFERSVIGLCAGASSALFICPIDVINTHIKAKLVNETGIGAVAANILKNQGIAAFYRGALPSMFSLGVGSSVFWGIHAHTRLLFAGSDDA
jgi:hypothetical protein